MKLCLELKVNAYPELLSLLSLTQDRAIIEDCSKRASLSGLFWGMKFDGLFAKSGWKFDFGLTLFFYVILKLSY